MEALAKALLMIHVVAGFASLGIFWIPMFTRKGGLNHRRLGKVYVFLMWIVVGTAALLSIKNLLIGNFIQAAFLGFLALITGNVLWSGMAVLRNKEGLSAGFQAIRRTLDFSVFLFGLVLVIYGIVLKGQGTAVLMLIFGILGLSDFPKVRAHLRGNASTAVNWFDEHLEGMITSGIAAYTAFFVFGGRQFFEGWLPGYWAIIPWVAPTVIGMISMKYLKAYYTAQRRPKTAV